MANRSYIYATDAPPGEDEEAGTGSSGTGIRGISEHRSTIPLAHLLLAGRGTRGTGSAIWDPPIGILADHAGGVELLLGFLAVVGAGEVTDRTGFDFTVEQTREYLEHPDNGARYVLLEIGEILDLYCADLDEVQREHGRYLSDEIPDAVRRADAAIAGRDDDWLAGVRRDWPEHFSSLYSPVLYFSFP